jgi:hypothetical protein
MLALSHCQYERYGTFGGKGRKVEWEGAKERGSAKTAKGMRGIFIPEVGRPEGE